MLSLLLALGLVLNRHALAEVCLGYQVGLDINIVPASDAPSGATSLEQWCDQFGWDFANIVTSQFSQLYQLGQICGINDGNGIAVASINGIQWAQCLLTEQYGLRFPTDPGSECAFPVAVACLPRPLSSTSTTTSISFLRKATVTETTTTTTTTSSTSTRFKTLPCGTSTVLDTLTSSIDTTTTETVTVTLQPTVHCPPRQPRICPFVDDRLAIVSQPESRFDQAQCACSESDMSLAVVNVHNIKTAASVLTSCVGPNSKAWIDFDLAKYNGNSTSSSSSSFTELTHPCLVTDEYGHGEVFECNADEVLPVLCRSHCGPHGHCDAPSNNVLFADQSTCSSGNVVLITGGSFPNGDYTAACAVTQGFVMMDYVPELYDDNIISIANNCPFFGVGWARSFNGTVAQCQQVGSDGTTVYDLFALENTPCTQTLAGVWCAAEMLQPIVSSTGTVVPTTSTVTVIITSLTTSTSLTTTTGATETIVITTVASTVRSLVLTPYTTTTSDIDTIFTTETITATSTIYTSVSSTTTVSLK